MSHPRRPSAPYGDGDAHQAARRQGSVSAARQRAQDQGEHTLRADYYGQPSRPNLPMSQYNAQQRPQSRPQPMSTPPSSSGNGMTTRNSPNPNWPLAAASEEDDGPRQKGPPPQRPPRPSYVPSILDPTKQHGTHLAPPPMPRKSGRPKNPEPPSPSIYPDDQSLSPSSYPSPSEGRPITTSSFASNSSLGEIPDFPVPNMPPPPVVPSSRKSLNLGLPPSARRGPSSYYSQMSYVSPIVEEAESNRSHNSFASSNVIPSNANEFYFDEDATPSDEDVPMASPSTQGGSEDGRSSRATDDGDQTGLVRHASLGKRGKPSLTTIKSVDGLEKLAKSKGSKEKDRMGAVGQAAVAAGAAGGAFAAGYGASRDGRRSNSRPDSDALSAGTGLLPLSASSSMESVSSTAKRQMVSSPLARSGISPDSPVDPRVNEILGGLEKGGALGAGYGDVKRHTTLADRVGSRRPPRLNVDAVKEAEARGSLTSLPDLIRRATRLASNLDRGKTASRLGLDMWEAGGNADEKDFEFDRQRRSGSLSDMLTSFPPPGIGTPTADRQASRPVSHWPSALGMYGEHHPEGDGQSRHKKRGRTCCGMPLCSFVILVTFLFLLVAAAVIVPVVLIVLPRQASSNSADSALAACQKSTPCENGGTSVVDPTGSCSCLCANGYTGDRCTTASDSGCTTATIGDMSNATIGSSIPSLLSSSDSYQIPLNGSLLLSLFSSTNLSCTAENALVTFNGASSKKRSLDYLPAPPAPAAEVRLAIDELAVPSSSSSSLGPKMTTPPDINHLEVRQYSNDAATTKLGIVYDSSPSSSELYSTSTTGTASSATASTTAISSKRLEFARVGVLFVFQESKELSVAVTAQENLQTYFTELEEGDDSATNATAVNMGNGFTIDLSQWHITLTNGTQVGSLVE